MPSGTLATCPHCRRVQQIGATFTNVSFIGNAANIVVACSWCGRDFDATGGGDGTFSTVDGRLRRVAAATRSLRNALAPADVAEVRELRNALQELRASPSPGAADVDALIRSRPGQLPKFEEWAARNPGLLLVLIGTLPVLLWLLGALAPEKEPEAVVVNVTTTPSVSEVDDATIERVVDQVLKEQATGPGRADNEHRP